MEYVDGPSGQERCLGSSLMIIIAYQAIGVEKTVFGAHFQGSRQVLLNTLNCGAGTETRAQAEAPSGNGAACDADHEGGPDADCNTA